jgi:hypothetical protein
MEIYSIAGMGMGAWKELQLEAWTTTLLLLIINVINPLSFAKS